MGSLESIEQLKIDLEEKFPEYNFCYENRFLTGKCLCAMSTKINGADIFLNGNKLKIIPTIPDRRTRILLGSGVLFLSFFSKKFKEPSRRIFNYLEETYHEIEITR